MGLLKKMAERLVFESHWRCREPVVVFESDDWGLQRKDCSNILRKYGEPKPWACEETEKQEDLDALYSLLARYRDNRNRHPCITANFILANPDYESIEKSGFSEYSDIPISSDKALSLAWLKGNEQGVFFPQYHGRSHMWENKWLKDLQDDVRGARDLFRERCHGGLSLLKGQGQRYRSEYVGFEDRKSRPPVELEAWLEKSLADFRALFGYSSMSTVPANYVYSPLTAQAWRTHDIKYIQSSNYHVLFKKDGSEVIIPHIMGEQDENGLILLHRNVKLEPASGLAGRKADACLKAAEQLFRHQCPVVVETHRINFTGKFRQAGLRELERFLEGISKFQPIYLTTVELGEAVENKGQYTDMQQNETAVLSACPPPWHQTATTGVKFLGKKIVREPHP